MYNFSFCSILHKKTFFAALFSISTCVQITFFHIPAHDRRPFVHMITTFCVVVRTDFCVLNLELMYYSSNTTMVLSKALALGYTTEKNMTNILTLVPLGTDVRFDDHLLVPLY